MTEYSPGRLRRLWWLGLLAVVLLAVVLRFYRIDTLPPGLHYDQAHDVVLAWETLIGQTRPIFYTGFTGAEPLFLYSTAVVMGVLGHTARALHVASALYGVLTIVVTFLTARELFGAASGRGVWVGLFAAGFMTTSGWHLLSSRNGFRAISLPLFEALTVWTLWVAFRTGRRAWWVVAGIALGATAYTYTSSRLVPLALALFLVWLIIKDRRVIGANLGGLALMLAVAALVFAPLGLFYAQNPAYLFVRADQTWIFSERLSEGDPWGALRDNVAAVLGMFYLKGDINWRFNIAPRPIFDPLMAALAGAGLLLFAWRAVRGEVTTAATVRRPLPSQAPYVLTLLFIGVMLVPSLLSVEGRPNSLRALGILPFLYFPPAVAVVAGIDGARRWLSPRRVAVGMAVAWVGLIGWQTVQTSQAYFDYWGHAADTYYHYDTDYLAMARAARAELAAGRAVVLASEHYKHPTIAWEAPETLGQARWVDPNAGLVYPGGDQDVVYLLARGTLQPNARLTSFLQELGATFETLVTDPGGKPSLVAARLPRERVPTAATLAGGDSPLSMGGDVWLLGGGLPESRKRESRLRGEVAWAVQRPTTETRNMATRLVDDQGIVWGQSDVTAYLSEQWRPGDTGLQFFDIRLDPTMPAGRYRVQVALADGDRTPLPVTDAAGAPVGLWVDIGSVLLESAGGVVQDIGRGVTFGPGLQVLGRDEVNATLPPGGAMAAAVTWQRIEGTPMDIARLVWLDTAGAVVAEQSLALSPTYPPTSWRVGEVVRPRYRIVASPTLAAGPYHLRLVAPGGATLDLGTVTIAGGPRRFEVGSVQQPRADRVGAEVVLVGYDLSSPQAAAGQPLDVILTWQALAVPGGDAARFVHLVDASGAVRAQVDGAPAAGQRPTSGWVEGEVVADAVRLNLPPDLPPGRYRLLTGMYDPTTLARQPARDAAGQRWPEDAIVLGEVEVTP